MKKLVALVLALALCLSLCTVTAFADGPQAITAAGGLLSAGEYVLNGDVTLTSNLVIIVGSGNTVTIDLQGHVLTGTGSGSVIAVTSGELILNDSVSTTTHVGYVDGNGLWHPGPGVAGTTSKTITGGVITGGSSDGGGVFVGSSGTFTMNGGSIAGNKNPVGGGGGVYVNQNGGTFTMNGGSITGNKASSMGGGVLSSGTFTMKGGSITGNKTNSLGSGVCIFAGTFTLGGEAQITGNATNNLYLRTDTFITLGTGTDAPKGSFKVGVWAQSSAPAKITTNGALSDADYFFPDVEPYCVDFNTDHLELKSGHRIKFAACTNGSVAAKVNDAAVTSAVQNNEVTIVATPDSGYELSTLTVTDADGNNVTVSENKFTMPNKAVTVSAKFTEIGSDPDDGHDWDYETLAKAGLVAAGVVTTVVVTKVVVDKLHEIKAEKAAAAEEVKLAEMPVVAMGSSSDAVTTLQTELNAQGYACGEADGVFGQNTLNAVKAFQTAKGLTADGVVGAQTWGALL